MRAYMHGFFMHNKLWQKAKAIAAPVDYATVRKERIQSKMEADRAQRITLKRKLPKVTALKIFSAPSIAVVAVTHAVVA